MHHLFNFKQVPKHRDAVLVAQGAAFFNQGQFIQAAQSYSQSASAPFEEVALKFVDAGERDALRYFLRSRLTGTRKTVSKAPLPNSLALTLVAGRYSKSYACNLACRVLS
jgi:hypothetical protein